jgi:hypothetical protein
MRLGRATVLAVLTLLLMIALASRAEILGPFAVIALSATVLEPCLPPEPSVAHQ